MKINDRFKEHIIRKVINGDMSVKKASIVCNYSRRHTRRLVSKARVNGINSLFIKRRIKPPINKVPIKKETAILNLYKTRYNGFNFQHYLECLKEKEQITASYFLVYRILTSHGIKSPKCQKTKHKNNVHPLRPRRSRFGELVQIDASIHNWFGTNRPKAGLHGAIDDATGTIVGLSFDFYETLSGYYTMLYQILTKYGVPEAFYSDNRTVFEYRKQKDQRQEYDTNTQFKRCCSQLGIELITTSVSQAKGRVERLWGTLQSRLLNELKLNKIQTIEDANKFLPNFVIRFNRRFGVSPINKESAFVKGCNLNDINFYLSIIVERYVRLGAALKYKNNFYQLVNSCGEIIKLQNNTIVKVIETYDKRLFGVYKNKMYSLLLASKPKEEKKLILKNRTKYIPSGNHPWRSFVINPKKNR